MRAWDYPYDVVRIRCPLCPSRRGRYSKARFLELVGESTQLPDALRAIAHDCPKNQPGKRRLTDQCQATYLELANQPRRQ